MNEHKNTPICYIMSIFSAPPLISTTLGTYVSPILDHDFSLMHSNLQLQANSWKGVMWKIELFFVCPLPTYLLWLRWLHNSSASVNRTRWQWVLSCWVFSFNNFNLTFNQMMRSDHCHQRLHHGGDCYGFCLDASDDDKNNLRNKTIPTTVGWSLRTIVPMSILR